MKLKPSIRKKNADPALDDLRNDGSNSATPGVIDTLIHSTEKIKDKDKRNNIKYVHPHKKPDTNKWFQIHQS